ncbi:MAG: hypothetical protein OEU92_11365, partial [Alphaproteobacteria bacterium]|nr:hypothetical protein [Alphaproteobacteria bacterium]
MPLFDDTLREIFALGYGYLVAMALAMARATGMAIVLPIFVRTGITGILRSGVVIAITLPLVPYVMSEIDSA